MNMIKEDELMIGDWISFKGIYKQINSILYDGHKYRITFKEDVKGYYIDECDSIRITENILHLNDFTYKEEVNEWWHYDPFPFSDFQLGYDEDNNLVVIINFDNTNITVNYVHQLQNILRCCRLNKLADNFKIK